MDPREELQALRRMAELEARAGGARTPTSLPPMPDSEIPQWGRDNPRLYGVAGALRETLGLPVEALASAAGGVLGTAGGPIGSIGGAGLGYGIGKGITRLADQALGNVAPVSAGEGLTRAVGDVATGATMEGVGRIAAPAIAKGVGWVGDRLVGPSLAKLNAAKIARDVAGAKLPQVQQAIANAPSNITAAQAIQEAGINSPPMQALGDLAARKASTHFSDQLIQQEAARLAALKAAAPDLDVATAAQKAFSAANYGKAFDADAQRLAALAQQSARNAAFGGAGGAVPVQAISPELQALKGIPAIEAASKAASARMTGGGDPMETLQGLHTMKLAIDAQLKNPTLPTSLQSLDKSALMEARTRLLEAIEGTATSQGVSPLYKLARADHEVMARPIEQSNILNNLASILQKPGGGERATPFLNALGRGEDAALKGAGVNPAFGDIESKLLPHQYEPVVKAAKEIERNIQMGKAAKEGSTELAAILDKDTLSLRKLIPNVMNRTVTGTVKALDLAESALSRKTTEALTEAMKSGKNLQDLFNTIPMSERNKILKVMIDKDPSLLVRAARIAPGAATVNALSSRQNENALAD